MFVFRSLSLALFAEHASGFTADPQRGLPQPLGRVLGGFTCCGVLWPNPVLVLTPPFPTFMESCSHFSFLLPLLIASCCLGPCSPSAGEPSSSSAAFRGAAAISRLHEPINEKNFPPRESK